MNPERTMWNQLKILALYWLLSATEIHGWSHNYLPTPPKLARDVAAAVCIGGSVLFHPLPSEEGLFFVPPVCYAMIDPSSMDEKQLRQSLKPATESQPQIMLPATSTVPVEKQPIVEGLISLANPNGEPRPMATDFIVITFRTLSQPDSVLGGARIPVSKAARFPLAFRLFPKNLLPDQQDVWNNLQNSEGGVGDLLVQALVCSEDNPKCTETESRMKSQGVAKLIRNLPGQLKDQTIRAPAALRLQ